MTVAIISVKTREAQRDESGHPHIYQSESFAEGVCHAMNKRAADANGVDPLHGIPQLFRVVPW